MATCSVDGCKKPGRRRGWCSGHYYRWRVYGEPTLGAKTRRGETEEFLSHEVWGRTTDECVLWPFAKGHKGYAHMRRGGRDITVHRMVCIEAHGSAPSPRHHAAHSCGKGHLGCVNPKHLEWKTPEGNEADKKLHGTDNRGMKHPLAKLTDDDVRGIRAACRSGRRQASIAQQFGVAQSIVSMISTRRIWRHVV